MLKSDARCVKIRRVRAPYFTRTRGQGPKQWKLRGAIDNFLRPSTVLRVFIGTLGQVPKQWKAEAIHILGTAGSSLKLDVYEQKTAQNS